MINEENNNENVNITALNKYSFPKSGQAEISL
jgi:hypothetical protein